MKVFSHEATRLLPIRLLDWIFQSRREPVSDAMARRVPIRKICCILRNSVRANGGQACDCGSAANGDPGHNICVSWLTIAWRLRRSNVSRTRRVDLQRQLVNPAVIGSLSNRDMPFVHMTNALPSRTVPL